MVTIESNNGNKKVIMTIFSIPFMKSNTSIELLSLMIAKRFNPEGEPNFKIYQDSQIEKTLIKLKNKAPTQIRLNKLKTNATPINAGNNPLKIGLLREVEVINQTKFGLSISINNKKKKITDNF